MSGLIRLRVEPRAAIMAKAEVVWEDQPGAWRGALARIEDTSRSGACIRVSVSISVGAKLRIKWQREEFSGTALYCRRDGGDYILGILREKSEREAQCIVLPHHATAALAMALSANHQDAPVRKGKNVHQLRECSPEPGPAPIQARAAASPVAAEATPKGANEDEAPDKTTLLGDPSPRLLQGPERPRRNEPHAREPSRVQERTTVFNKLLNLGSGRQNQNGSEGNSGNAKVQVNSYPAEGIRENQTGTNAKAVDPPPRQGSLLSLQDIYLAVGIMNSRLGYNFDTVSAMLDSDHMRGMSSEVKKASVLMALEAAGIPVNELLQDGGKRLDALNAYEAG